MGVFVFALLIGDIRDIVGNARRNALSFQRHLDAITTYMNNNKVAKPVQVGFPIFILVFYLFHLCAPPLLCNEVSQQRVNAYGNLVW